MSRSLERAARVPVALRFIRRLWAACERSAHVQATCDRCGKAMLDPCQRGRQRICVQCVDEERRALGSAEQAGATAVLRALLLELEASALGGSAPSQRAYIEALLEVTHLVLWWMTPENLRTPSMVAVEEASVVAAFERFDAVWMLSMTAKNLTAVYAGWTRTQRRALSFAELQAADNAYARFLSQSREGR
jgi:hypothetical protein